MADSPSFLTRRKMLGLAGAAAATSTLPAFSATAVPLRKKPYIGTQISLPGFLEYGVEPILDLLQEKVGLNSFRIHADDIIAANHHLHSETSEEPFTNLTGVLIDFSNYPGTALKPLPKMGKVPAARRRELLQEVVEEAHARGITVEVRYLVFTRTEVQAVDCFSRLIRRPCWNHPDYQAHMRGLALDAFRTSPAKLDGWLQMNEDEGPLSDALFQHLGKTPGCFCPHCLEKAGAEGIDGERARRGYQELMKAAGFAGKPGTGWPDGALAGLLRLMMEFPEIPAWQMFQQRSNESIPRLVKDVIREHRPDARLGHHYIHHTGLNFVAMASFDYARAAEFCDYLCPLLYHTHSGSRWRTRLDELHPRFFPEIPEPELWHGWMRLHGLDPKVNPADPTTLADAELDVVDWVSKETKRVKAAVADKAEVHPNVGWEPETGVPLADPRQTKTYRATIAAVEAGGDGILIPRTFAPALFFGKGSVQPDMHWNSRTRYVDRDSIEGDVGPRTLAAFRAALQDVGWID